jgi:putative glutamine amidotransferase
MSDKLPMPLVGIAATYTTDNPNRHPLHTTSDKYLCSVVEGASAMPVSVPALGEAIDVGRMADSLDGLLLPGGRANIEPHNYGGPPFPDDEFIDPRRDATVLPLVRACIDKGVPVFGICRGIQEMNVALGGSLHYRIHLLPGKEDHRMRRDLETTEERMALRHSISLTQGGLLEELVGESEVMVNSLHGQGVDRPAEGLVIEAMSPDGVIEAVRLSGAKSFAVGVQWHAEWGIEHHTLSRRLFETFGDAARERALCKNRIKVT